MNTLRLEELEQRDLLNAAYHVPPPAPREFGDVRANWDMERSTLAHLNNQDSARVDSVSPRSSIVLETSSRSFFDGGSFLIVPAREIVVVVISIQMPDQNGGGTQSDGGGADSGGTVTTPAPVPRPMVKVPTPSAPETTTSTVADLSGIRAQAAAAAAPRPASQTTPFVLVPPASVPALVADPHGTVAIAANQNYHGLNGIIPGSPATAFPATSGGAIVEDPSGETVEPPPAQPEPAALPGVLSALSTGDLTALGRELGQFLNRIEKAGEELVGDGDGLRPWLIAGAAAATACEIARRQLKRAAELAEEDIADVRPDHLFVG
jgi:hypothetical protein